MDEENQKKDHKFWNIQPVIRSSLKILILFVLSNKFQLNQNR